MKRTSPAVAPAGHGRLITAPACSACTSVAKRTKLLSCIHRLCSACLEENVSASGAIKCPSCAASTPLKAGVLLLESLPNAPVISDGAREAGLPNSCDECFGDIASTSVCLDCNLALCRDHATAHRKSKSTHDHQITDVSFGTDGIADGLQTAATGGRVRARRCTLHPSETIVQYCQDCEQLLCERCVCSGMLEVKQRRGKQSKHTVLHVSKAAEELRGKVTSVVESLSLESDSGLSSAISSVKEDIDLVNDQTEAASEEAKQFYSALVTIVNKRQEKVLAELDQLRYSKLIPLEKQLSKLESGQVKCQHVHDILKSNVDSVDMLLMGNWLVSHVKQATEAAEQVPQHHASSGITFRPTDNARFLDITGNAGLVRDFADLALEGPELSAVGSTVIIGVSCTGQAPAELGGEHLVLCATDPDKRRMACSLDKLQKKVTFMPLRTGRHTLTATLAGRHVEGSPREMLVCKVCPLFDNVRPDLEMALRVVKSNRTARNIRTDGKRVPAWTTSTPREHAFSAVRLRIDSGHANSMFFCACSSKNPEDCVPGTSQSLHGWHGGGSDMCSGTELGQPWRSGDTVRLEMDFKQHTLKGVHERTGATQVLQNVTGEEVRWYVSLWGYGNEVTLVQ